MEIIESNKRLTKVFHDGDVYQRNNSLIIDWYKLEKDDSRLISVSFKNQHDLEDLYQIELLRITREKKLNRIV